MSDLGDMSGIDERDFWDAPETHTWVGLKVIGHGYHECQAEAHWNTKTNSWSFACIGCQVSMETFGELLDHLTAAHRFEEMV